MISERMDKISSFAHLLREENVDNEKNKVLSKVETTISKTQDKIHRIHKK